MRTIVSVLCLVPLLVLSSGCYSLAIVEVPAERGSHEPIFGPVTVESVRVETCRHQMNPTGFLGLYDFIFLAIEAQRADFDSLASRAGSADLADFWRKGIEARLTTSGAFGPGVAPVRISVDVARARKATTWIWFILVEWVLSPIYTLCGGPNSGNQVMLDVTFTASVGGPGGTEHRYEYHYDEERFTGLYYGGDHTIGAALTQLTDRFVTDLENDVSGGTRAH